MQMQDSFFLTSSPSLFATTCGGALTDPGTVKYSPFDGRLEEPAESGEERRIKEGRSAEKRTIKAANFGNEEEERLDSRDASGRAKLGGRDKDQRAVFRGREA